MGAKEDRLKQWRLVVDTNLIVSAVLFNGITSEILQYLENGTFKLVVSKEILEEYIRVFSYPKFSLSEDEIKFIINEIILKYAETIKSRKYKIPDSLDPDDDKFINCAVSAGADALLSGDQHLLKLKEFKGIPILSFQEFVDRFLR